MESNEEYLDRCMGLYAFSTRRDSKIVRAKETVSEWSEQLAFCKWLKKEYPDILFRSDIQSAGKKSPQMQNIKQIIDPFSGWPDIMIYEQKVSNMEILSAGLAIEMKSTTAKLSGEHWKNQSEMHQRLKLQNWHVHVAFGAEEAKEIFKKYYHTYY